MIKVIVRVFSIDSCGVGRRSQWGELGIERFFQSCDEMRDLFVDEGCEMSVVLALKVGGQMGI